MRYLLLFLLSFPCYAIKYDLNGRFSDGAELSGFIQYPAVQDFGLVSNWDISTSFGTLSAFHYTPQNSEVVPNVESTGQPTAIITNSFRGIILLLPFEAWNGEHGDVFPIVTKKSRHFKSQEFAINGGDFGAIRAVASGTATVVPEPSLLWIWLGVIHCVLIVIGVRKTQWRNVYRAYRHA